MVEIICDKCKKDFTLIQPGTSIVRDDILKTWFKCPHCGYRYISHYTNKGIRELQAVQERLRIGPQWNKRKIKHKLKDLQDVIKTGMDRLKQEIEGAS